MGDGKIDAKMRCSAGGGTQLMTMAGTYGPDQYQMRMTTQIDPGKAAAAIGAMTMKMQVEGKRIGDCDAGTRRKADRQISWGEIVMRYLGIRRGLDAGRLLGRSAAGGGRESRNR